MTPIRFETARLDKEQGESDYPIVVRWIGETDDEIKTLGSVTIRPNGLVSFKNQENIEINIENCLDAQKHGLQIGNIEMEVHFSPNGVELRNFFNAQTTIRGE